MSALRSWTLCAVALGLVLARCDFGIDTTGLAGDGAPPSEAAPPDDGGSDAAAEATPIDDGATESTPPVDAADETTVDATSE